MQEESQKILGAVTISPEIISLLSKELKDISYYKEKIKEYCSHTITELVDVILYGAILLDSSDIHLEPQEKDARLRIRLDGILQDVYFFSRELYRQLLSRFKLLSRLKLNITNKPQDGRFTIKLKDYLIEIRTSSLPAEYGESIVMRILNPKNLLSLEDLGLRKDLYKIFLKEIQKPNGMIIVTGPTGSGKTTTLYAFLKKIQDPSIKIITIEDPIEYHLVGISQTQVAPEKGYTFAAGLRSIVRQDPDVILVGEIRDLETANIALQAALTGHLVLSTLHTNDAAGTVPRLVDLGVETSSIAPALKMAVAQRLARKVCKHCSVPGKPSEEELKEFKDYLKNIPKEAELPPFEKILISRPKEGGCPACNFTGYKGRIGLFESFLVDAEMERFILTNPPVSEMRIKAIQKGMITMYQSGLIAIAQGITTFDEVKRVVEIEEQRDSIRMALKT